MFGGGVFSGLVSLDAFYPVDLTRDTWAPAARWCNRCWLLIPNGQKAYNYGHGSCFDICQPCHRAILGKYWNSEP